MTEITAPQRSSNSFPIRVIACPHCGRLARYLPSRWGLSQWVLYTDLARESTSRAEPHPIAKCPHCGNCFWRREAATMGYLHPERMDRIQEQFGQDRIPEAGTPFAADLERAIINGLPRFRSEIWRLHLMAWRRLNDSLRFESVEARTATSIDEPIRAYVAHALMKNMPNRHPLTRLLRIDILRQIARFSQARKSARSLLDGMRIVKSLGEQESRRRNSLYSNLLTQQIELIDREDRLPRRFVLTSIEMLGYHMLEKEMLTSSGADEVFRSPQWTGQSLWRRVETSGWTCHNCARGGRAGTDFTYDGRVICRHCGWPQ